MEVLPEDSVLIVGGGPVGLLLATVLAHYEIKSVVLERNESTTKSAYSEACKKASWLTRL